MTGPRVLHVIPYDGIGGVEIAARSLPSGVHDGLRFGKLFIADRPADGVPSEADTWTGPRPSENAPVNYVAATRHVLDARPDLVLVSLWRSCIVALLAKAMRPRLRLVAFLHLPQSVHMPDRLLNLAVMHLSREIWCDSETTLRERVPARLRARARVVSFLTERRPRVAPSTPGPQFLFWGRLHAQKGLDAALDVFARLAARHPEARYTLIGPDMGARSALEARARDLGIADKVAFTGPLEAAAIATHAAQASFYLQASTTEGMALSVVEAMQFGLIPVVRPVGEIARYCTDGETALFLTGDTATDARRLDALLDEPARAGAMATAARAVWADAPLYRDSVLGHARQLLNGIGNQAVDDRDR